MHSIKGLHGSIMLSFFLVLFPPLHVVADGGGAVCLGPNAMVAPYTLQEHVTLTIGDSQPIDFMSQSEKPRVVVNGLDLAKTYLVKVSSSREVLQTFTLDFQKFKTTLVQIWRGPGEWKMQDACGGVCGAVLKCPKAQRVR